MKDLNTATSQQRGIFSRAGVRYEVACDVIGAVIAHYAELMANELASAKADQQRISMAQRLTSELKDAREELDSREPDAIESAIERFGALARHLYADADLSAAQARRAAQFDQANASLALEGLDASVDDLAVQARIIRGEWSHDQAVAWYLREAQS
jgi:F0F1-type ATP synthase membrane subunit b/b'